MTPWTSSLALLLVAASLALPVTAMSTQGRPMTDARSDVALEYVSTHTLAFMMISLLILLMFAALPRAARSLS